MSTNYWITVLGPDARAIGRAYLNCEDARQASIVAFNTTSPFGHQLWFDGRLIGVFDVALSASEATSSVD